MRIHEIPKLKKWKNDENDENDPQVLRFQPKLEPMIGRLSPSWYHTRQPVVALRQKIVAYVEVGAEPN